MNEEAYTEAQPNSSGMGKKTVLTVVIVVVLVLVCAGLVWMWLNAQSQLDSSKKQIDTLTSQIQQLQSEVETLKTQPTETGEPDSSDEEDTTSDGSDTVDTQDQEKKAEVNYKYNYDTEAIRYEPDPNNYTGFRICDNQASTCSVYAVKSSQIATEVVLGKKYKLSFDSSTSKGAATGTSYHEVSGSFELKAL